MFLPLTAHAQDRGHIRDGSDARPAPPTSSDLLEQFRFLPKVRKKSTVGEKVKKLKNGKLRFHRPGFNADIGPDGKVRFRLKPPSADDGAPMHPQGSYGDRVMGAFDGLGPRIRGGWVPGGSGGSLGSGGDVTELVMRAKGEDPYYAQKIQFLDQTRNWRLDLKKRAFQWRAKKYLLSLPSRLRRIWNDEQLTIDNKKRRFFELWDECLEPDGSKRGRLAQRARSIIIDFIKEHLPVSGPHAYTRKQLQEFRKRREGKRPFDPYNKD
jgi:hypothetical protein